MDSYFMSHIAISYAVWQWHGLIQKTLPAITVRVVKWGTGATIQRLKVYNPKQVMSSSNSKHTNKVYTCTVECLTSLPSY